jgi:hypothetical protein
MPGKGGLLEHISKWQNTNVKYAYLAYLLLAEVFCHHGGKHVSG